MMELAGSAIFSRAAIVAARRHHAVARLEVGDAGADAFDHARHFRCRRKREGRLDLVLALDHQDVEEIQRRGLDRDHGLAGPATGSGTSVSTRSSGPQYCEQKNGFHGHTWVLEAQLRLGRFLPDFAAGLQSDSKGRRSRSFRGAQIARKPKAAEQRDGGEPCLKKACSGESGYWSPAAAPGLGLRWGRRFVELGAELIICGRRLELLEATASELSSDLGGKVTAIKCDIRDGAGVDAMLDAVWRDAPLDVLVNNAAATFIAQTEHLSFRAADAILAPTLHGAMYCTLGAGRRWIEARHKGVVLSILSTSTITGRAFTVPSAMAKSAVLAMTKSLAVEWGPKASAPWRSRRRVSDPGRFRPASARRP